MKAKAENAVRELAKVLEDNFVFPDVGKAYAARLRERLASGAYAAFPDAQAFAQAVTADLQAVQSDGHLKLMVVPEAKRPNASGPMKGPPPSSGLVKSGWLAPGVAYVRFDVFPGNDATLADVRAFIDAHKDAKTLIIDAREHKGGGLAEMNLLFPQLYKQPAVLVGMDTRLAVEQQRGSPVGEDDFMRVVSGPGGVVRREHYVEPAAAATGLRDAKVYLLTSKKTASAAEHLALSLKRTKRATLVGESTAGAGHFGGVIPIDDTYVAWVPVGRTFDPDTNEGWEGTGVKPDVAVPADKALDEALKLAGINKSADVALAELK